MVLKKLDKIANGAIMLVALAMAMLGVFERVSAYVLAGIFLLVFLMFIDEYL